MNIKVILTGFVDLSESNIKQEEFMDKFIEWLKANNLYFEVIEDI